MKHVCPVEAKKGAPGPLLAAHTGTDRATHQSSSPRCSRPSLILLPLVLQSKSAAAGGVPFASHTPCLGALVTIPPRLMQSYHCLEIWAAARVSWLKGSTRRQMLLHETSSFTSPNTAHQSWMASWPLSQYVPMAGAPACPALRTGPSITTTIGHESYCFRVFCARIIRRHRGRNGGLRGFVRLSPFLVSNKGRCPLCALIPEEGAT